MGTGIASERAIIYVRDSADASERVQRCWDWATRAGYILVKIVRDDSAGTGFAAVDREICVDGTADYLIVPSMDELPPDRRPRLIVVDEEDRRRRRPRLRKRT